MKEGFLKTLLHHILGVLPVFRYPLRYRENFLHVAKHQFLKSLRLSRFAAATNAPSEFSFVLIARTAFMMKTSSPSVLQARLNKARKSPEDGRSESAWK